MIPLEGIQVRPVGLASARRMIALHHYAQTTPSTVNLTLGMWQEQELLGVALLGYGTRPLHTIRRLFPSLGTSDYLEVCRLWVDDRIIRNGESWFLSRIAAYVKLHRPAVQVLFSWADGLRGKPGYIYQASNWLYGGFIISEFYRAPDGEVVHPRLLITRGGTRNRARTRSMGLVKYHGRQFRYIRFLCNRKDTRQLLTESPFTWSTEYPKDADCIFWTEAGEGSRESRELPMLKGSGRFRQPAPLFDFGGQA